jgi:choline kinase
MHETTAIILAAGRGIRMGPRGQLSPKGLLRFDGKPFVEESIDTLRGHGIEQVTIVTGHLSEAYEAAARSWAAPIELLFNERFADMGTLKSLLVGLEGRAADCVIVESDIVYEPRALDPIRQDACGVILSQITGSGDEVYCWTERVGTRHQMIELSKDPSCRPGSYHGEFVCITYLSAAGVRRLKEIGPALLERDGKMDYERALEALAREMEFSCDRIDDLAWSEADDEVMYARVEKQIYPRVVAARRDREGLPSRLCARSG